jgi:hypothetical protein
MKELTIAQDSVQRNVKGVQALIWAGIVALCLFATAFVAGRMVIKRAEPIVRGRVIETLSERFKGKVDLARFDVSVNDGIEVSGGGLRIFGPMDPNPSAPGVQPLISVADFHFRSTLRSLFRSPMHIETVYVKGLELNIPPKEYRGEMKDMGANSRKMKIVVDRFVCEDTKLIVNTLKPGKLPLEFDIHNLKMKEVGPGQASQFDATLVNPKPVGDIQSSGNFGPFDEENPRDTPVQGNYSLSNADLGTLKGIGGILSSTGGYEGTLSNIVVDGKTDTPDFQLSRSGHPVPLHTDFHAVVDGTNGDTYLQPVYAHLLHSSFVAKGSVVRSNDPKGHEIELDVVMNHAQIEDMLRLGVKTDPPVMTGPLQMKTRLSLPPGDEDVADRLKLAGTFHVLSAHFSNPKIQDKLDSLSLRSEGKPKEAKEHVQEQAPVDLQGTFNLNQGLLSFSSLQFKIPGTQVAMTGDYSLDGQTFDFHGEARLGAKLSQMTTGWKSVLLKPVDPFFSKNGAGTEVPIKVTGTQSEPHFGLDFGRRKEDQKVEGKTAPPQAKQD